QEVFLSLTMANVANIVNDPNTGSRLVRISGVDPATPPAGNNPPLANGTFSGVHAANPNIASAAPKLDVSIGGVPSTLSLTSPAGVTIPGAVPTTTAAPVLEAAIRAAQPTNTAYTGATVQVQGNQLRIL